MLGNVPVVTLWAEAESEDVTSLWTSHTSHQPLAGLAPSAPLPLRLWGSALMQTNKGKNPSNWKKKNSNLQTVTAELCFSENYHKLIHQYLALRTKNRECPTIFFFFFNLLPNQQAATTACPSGTDRHYLCPSHQSQGGEGWVRFLTEQLHSFSEF